MSKKNIDILADKLLAILKEDILERYNNSEYWEQDLIEDFRHDEKLTDKECEELYETMG